jgi:hypothetical protein
MVASSKCLTLEKGLTLNNSLKLFKKLLYSYVATSDEEAPKEVLSPPEAKLFIDHMMTGYVSKNSICSSLYTVLLIIELMFSYFQHYRLYQYVQTNEQEKEETEISIKIEHPEVPLPLVEAITLEAHEAELARLRDIEEREREEKLRREAEERASKLKEEKPDDA